VIFLLAPGSAQARTRKFLRRIIEAGRL